MTKISKVSIAPHKKMHTRNAMLCTWIPHPNFQEKICPSWVSVAIRHCLLGRDFKHRLRCKTQNTRDQSTLWVTDF